MAVGSDDPNVAALVKLAEGQTVEDCRSTREYWLKLWQIDHSLFGEVLDKSVSLWKRYYDIFEGLTNAALELSDRDCDQLLEQYCKRVRGDLRLQLQFVLVCRGSTATREQYVKTFNRNFAATKAKKYERNENDLALTVLDVRRACLLRLNELLPTLEQLQALAWEVGPERYRGVWTFRYHADAAVLMFREGKAGLSEKIRDKSADHELREACMYCLGCLRDPNAFEVLQQTYDETGEAGTAIALKLTAIEAIVYSARREDLSEFLARSIQERLPQGLQKSVRERALERLFAFISTPGDAVLKRLLRGVYFAPRVTDRTLRTVEQCLQAGDEVVAALAWLSLTRHGRHPMQRSEIGQAIKDERLFLKESGQLMTFRRILG